MGKKTTDSEMYFLKRKSEEEIECLDTEDTANSLMSNQGETKETENREDDYIPNYACNICKTLKGDKPYHCDSCDVCIDSYDHHCPWIGKVFLIKFF